MTTSSIQAVLIPLFNTINNNLFDSKNIQEQTQQKKKNVIVVGSGYAGRSFAEGLNKNKYNVKVVSPNAEPFSSAMFVHQSSFTGCVTSGILDNSISTWKPKDISFQLGTINRPSIETNSIFLDKQTKEDDQKSELKYDILVLALGSIVNTFNIPGVKKYCLHFKTLDDIKIICSLFKSGKLNKQSKIAVLGGGVLGIEVSSAIKDKTDQVTIFEMAPTILPIKDFENIRNDLQNYLNEQGIDIKTNHKISKIERDDKTGRFVVHLSTDKTEEFDQIIYTCGVKPHQKMEEFNFKMVNDNFQIMTKDDKTIGNVYAIGDCNKIQPMSAQNAKQQGGHLAKILNEEQIEEYKFKSLGTVIRLNNCVYIKSNYYNGFAPSLVHDAIGWLNV